LSQRIDVLAAVIVSAIGDPAGFLDAMLKYELRMDLSPVVRQATVYIRMQKAGPSFKHGRWPISMRTDNTPAPSSLTAELRRKTPPPWL
jgi:hypothetical protein